MSRQTLKWGAKKPNGLNPIWNFLKPSCKGNRLGSEGRAGAGEATLVIFCPKSMWSARRLGPQEGWNLSVPAHRPIWNVAPGLGFPG